MTEVDGMHVSGGQVPDLAGRLLRSFGKNPHREHSTEWNVWNDGYQAALDQPDVRPISGHPFEVQRDGIYPNVCIVCGEVADHPNHQLDVSAVSGDEVESNDLLPE